MSVDWSRHCTPQAMVLRHPTWGVVSFRVGDIPERLPDVIEPGSNQKPVLFSLDHAPLPNNAAHTHVLALDEAGEEKPVKSRTVKSSFREAIRRSAVVSIHPAGMTPIAGP